MFRIGEHRAVLLFVFSVGCKTVWLDLLAMLISRLLCDLNSGYAVSGYAVDDLLSAAKPADTV